MIVAKFGGTSVATADAIGRLSGIVRSRPDVRCVVASALAGVTDALVAAGDAAGDGRRGDALALVGDVCRRYEELAADLGVVDAVAEHTLDVRSTMPDRLAALGSGHTGLPAWRDETMAVGELLSSRLVAAALRRRGANAVWVDARRVVVTNAEHTRAAPDLAATRSRLQTEVAPLVRAGHVAVLGGFIGATPDGVTTTLGRGGSDFSAALIGAGLDASVIDIWTDVDGMLSADPRVVAGARLVPALSFAEASELAYFGAKVLHPSTILPAMARDIPVRILNARRPDGAGTLITASAPAADGRLRALACKRGVTVVHITSTRMLMAYGFLRRVFEAFERHRTVVDVVTTSEVSVSVTVDDARAVEHIAADLEPIADVGIETGLALVCAVGEQLRIHHHLCAEVLDALGGLPVRMVSQSASRQNLTLVVADPDLDAAMNRLHDRFFGGASRAAQARRVEAVGGGIR